MSIPDMQFDGIDWHSVPLPSPVTSSGAGEYLRYRALALRLFGSPSIPYGRTRRHGTYAIFDGHLLFKNEADRTFFLLSV